LRCRADMAQGGGVHGLLEGRDAQVVFTGSHAAASIGQSSRRIVESGRSH
jgi:hypothetical protein